MNNTFLIIKREYKERVIRKSFIISTILTPLLMLALMVAPMLITLFSSPENKNVAVIDRTGVIAPALQNTEDLNFSYVPDSLEMIKANEAYDAILVIASDAVDNPDHVEYYSHGSSSIQTEQFISAQMSSIIEQVRLGRYDIDNLAQILADVKAHVTLKTYRLDGDENEETSSTASYAIGMVAALMLYTFIMIYGQMVMTSIIEEKNNRVLEIVVSSVKPFQLMLGKILGIGLVALTQIVIWGLLISSFTTWVMPSITSSMVGSDAGLTAMMSMVGDTGYVLSIFGYTAVFLILGYLFYSAIYSAIGSAVDNIQDASQLQSFAIIPIILGLVFSMTVINDPNSTLATWFSMIPFTSPMVMMARIPFGIPTAEIFISMLILLVSVIFMVWLSAKIYRVGIFMYGKKPTVKELIRWARYK
jgi:ABC-2 type transport system permease protein